MIIYTPATTWLPGVLMSLMNYFSVFDIDADIFKGKVIAVTLNVKNNSQLEFDVSIGVIITIM